MRWRAVSLSDPAKHVYLLIDLINDFEFEGGDELLKLALPMSRRIAELKKLATKAGISSIYLNDLLMTLAEGLIDGRTLCSEKPGSLRSDIETVLQPNAKLSVDHDGRLIAETHARLKRSLVAPYKVGPFMTV